jgi:hypothetical protein
MVDEIATTKQCRYCASEIPIQATLCATCKYHQSAWHNNLLFVGGLAGFIALVATAIVFAFNQATQAYHYVFRREDVKVLSLAARAPNLQAVLTNGGDDPVFVTQLIVHHNDGHFVLVINKLVNVNEIALVDTMEKQKPGDELFGAAENRSGLPSKLMIHHTKFSPYTPDDRTYCFYADIYDTQNPSLAAMKEFYTRGHFDRKPVILEDRATIFYHSTRASSVSQRTFPVSITFSRFNNEECQKLPLD